MFDRSAIAQLERLFSRTGTNQERVKNHSLGFLLILQSISEALGTVKGLWDNSFIQDLDGAADGTLVNGVSKRWWRLANAVFLAYTVFTHTKLSDLAQLTAPDGSKPFAVYDPLVLQELADLSLYNIAFAGPETSLPPSEPIV